MSGDKYEKLIADARRRSAKMDRIGERSGFASPKDCPPVEQIRTAMMAIESGIKCQDWKLVAEAQVLLENLSGQMKGAA